MLLTLAQRKQLFAICSCTLTSLSDSLSLTLSHTHTVCTVSSLALFLVWFESCLQRFAFWQFSCLHRFGNTWLPFGFAGTTHTHTHMYRRGTYTCSDSLTTWCSITIWQSDGFYRFLWGSNRKLCRNLICNLNWLLEFLGHAPQISWACVCLRVCMCAAHKSYLALGLCGSQRRRQHSIKVQQIFQICYSSRTSVKSCRCATLCLPLPSALPLPTSCGLCACVSEVIKIPGCLFKVAFYSKSMLI